MNESVRCLYAICRGLEPSAFLDVTGIGGGSVELLEVGDVQAVISTVGEEPARHERTDDVHDAVVRACMAGVATAPVRPDVTYPDDETIRRAVSDQYAALDGVLDSVAGCQEWIVTVSPGTSESSREQVAPAWQRSEPVEVRQAADAVLQGIAEEVDSALLELVVAHRRFEAEQFHVPDASGAMSLDAAYLVADDSAAEFSDSVDLLAPGYPEATIECSGPRPPYSFATLQGLQA